jgi:hypothetical protein
MNLHLVAWLSLPRDAELLDHLDEVLARGALRPTDFAASSYKQSPPFLPEQNAQSDH